MALQRGLLGEKYSNKRMVFRKGGKFAKPPTWEDLGFFTCPHCRRFNRTVVKPDIDRWGFIHPLSMKPQLPEACHNCGLPFSDDGMDKAINELMVLG